jgi:ligand-binding sensor domain-containing protein
VLYAQRGLLKILHTLTRKIHIGFIVVALAFWTSQAMAADSDLAEMASALRAWQSADGLPSDSVTAIIQTRDGFLWIGTSAGLVRFDGVKFTELKLSTSVKNNSIGITALCEDGDGHLWIGTQADGLFELAGGIVHHFSTAQGLLDNNVTSLAADNHEAIWIGTRSGLDFWSGKNFTSFTTQNGLSDNYISGVHVARSGSVWITTRNGMCRFI